MTTPTKRPLILDVVSGKLIQSQSTEISLQKITAASVADVSMFENLTSDQAVTIGSADTPSARPVLNAGPIEASGGIASASGLVQARSTAEGQSLTLRSYPNHNKIISTLRDLEVKLDDQNKVFGVTHGNNAPAFTVTAAGTITATAATIGGSSFATVVSDLGTAQTDIGNLQTDVGTLQTDVGNLQTDVGTLQTDVGNLQTDVGALDTNINNVSDRVDALELTVGGFADSFATDALTATSGTFGVTAGGAAEIDLSAVDTDASIVIKDSDGATWFSADQTGYVYAGVVSFESGTLRSMGSGADDIATKSYVDGMATGLQVKTAVKTVTEGLGNISLSGIGQTLNGYVVQLSDRIGVIEQTNSVNNGIWIAASGAWLRATDMANASEAAGVYFLAANGDKAGHGYVCQAPASADVVGTDPLPFALFSTATDWSFGNGLQVTGATTVSVKNADSSISVGSGGVAVALSGSTLEISSGLRVKGLPLQFEINGSAVSTNVTAANLGALTAGGSSDAAAVHAHFSDAYVMTAGESLSAGNPVCVGENGKAYKAKGATAAKAFCIGVAADSAAEDDTVRVIRDGVVPSVASGFAAGQAVYVGANGGLTDDPGTGSQWILVGYCLGGNQLFVQPQDMGYVAA